MSPARRSPGRTPISSFAPAPTPKRGPARCTSAGRSTSSSPTESSRSAEVQELREGAPYLLLKSLGKTPEVFPKELVVPGEYLVDEDVAVLDQPADAGRHPYP